MTDRNWRFALAAALALALAAAPAALAQTPAGARGDAFDAARAGVSIEAASFVAELQGANASFKELQPDKYRGLVLTLRVRKPPDEPLTIYAQDLALHYRFGAKRDVARCTGISAFSLTRDAERRIVFMPQGLGSMATAVNSTSAAEIFVDLFFQGMEPESSELDLRAAHPIGARHVTRGWK